MRKPETKTIGAYTFTVSMLPPRDAHRLLLRALKAAGPALAPLLTAAGGSLSDVQAAVRAAGDKREAIGGALVNALSEETSWLETAIQRLTEALDEKELDFIIDTLTSCTSVAKSGVPMGDLKSNFDFVFADDLKDMYYWLYFAWTTQFSGFFGFLGKAAKT